MIICSCTGVSDRTVAQLAADGAESVAEVTEACGAGGGCGTCHQSLHEVLVASVALRRACAA